MRILPPASLRARGAVLFSLVCAFVVASLGVTTQAHAAAYRYTTTFATANSIILDSLQCAKVAAAITDRLYRYATLNASYDQYYVADCVGDFPATAGSTKVFRLSGVNRSSGALTDYGDYTATLTEITGDVSDEIPHGQLLLTAVLCLGFGLGVIAGQQR